MRAALGIALLLLAGAAPGVEDGIELETLSGEPVVLAPRADERALLLHFWATWCPECEQELPVLAAARARCSGRGVRIETVVVGESRETITEYLERHGLALTPLRDPGGRSWRRLGGFGLPTNLTWTSEGRRIDVGPRDAEAWRAALSALGCGPERAAP